MFSEFHDFSIVMKSLHQKLIILLKTSQSLMTISYGADVSKEAIYGMHSAEHWTKELQINGDGKMKINNLY
jgi:hypothetical protein